MKSAPYGFRSVVQLVRIVIMKEAVLDFAKRREIPPPSWWTDGTSVSTDAGVTTSAPQRIDAECHLLTHAVQQTTCHGVAMIYSITSSERACSSGGMSMPSALAVLRLMTNSNLVGCMTGRSSGLAPLSIRPV